MIVLPFRGEFGWLVAMWVPWLRYLRMHIYKNGEFVVLCRPGEKALFADFAEKTIEIDSSPAVNRVDCANCFVKEHGRWRHDDELKFLQQRFHDLGWKLPTKKNTISPDALPFRWPEGSPPRPTHAEHIELCESIESNQDLVAVHARMCATKQPERNWPIKGWNELVGRLCGHGKTAIAIGSMADSVVPIGATDMRGHTLGNLMRTIAGCSMLVGPSSGPHALALQCATPVVWWSANAKDVERYQTAWNPFRILTDKAGVDWQPSVEDVFESTLRIAQQQRSRQS